MTSLNQGNAYFAESEKFKEYLQQVKPLDNVCDILSPNLLSHHCSQLGTCAHLRAAQMQNIVKFKNAVISGVVGVQCARHGFYMPQSMVDLTKGEAYVSFVIAIINSLIVQRFANTDYALSRTLLEAENQKWIMLSYDIWCQYGKNLRKRFDESFPEQAALLDRVRGAIPKMHVKNHVKACQQLYAFNYLKFSGETWGENIEGSWAEQNQTAGSTKEQNAGHRHDSLDDFFGFWNWTKMRQLHKCYLIYCIRCLSNFQLHRYSNHMRNA